MTPSTSTNSVALIVSSPDRRGAEVFASELAPRLTERGWHATLRSIDRASGPQPIETIEPLGSGRRSPLTWVKLLATCARFDIVVANGGTTLLPVMVAAAITRTPFVYRNIGDPTVWGAVRWADLRLGLPMRRARRVLALYPTAASVLRTRYRLDPDAVAVVPNAASRDAFSPATPKQHTDALATLGLEPSRPWIGYVGALSEEKRPCLAIEAILNDEHLGLVVVGDGPLRSECELLAARSPERVRLLGRREDVNTVLHAVDALVISSRTEGIAGSAIEAGLSGLPVVCTDVGGMAELVLHDETGIVVTEPNASKLASALRRAVDDRERLGSAARQRCLAQFELDAVADRWASCLTEALSTRGRNRATTEGPSL